MEDRKTERLDRQPIIKALEKQYAESSFPEEQKEMDPWSDWKDKKGGTDQWENAQKEAEEEPDK